MVPLDLGPLAVEPHVPQRHLGVRGAGGRVAWATGGRSGLSGSVTYQTWTGELSYRCTRSDSPSGAHQIPAVAPHLLGGDELRLPPHHFVTVRLGQRPVVIAVGLDDPQATGRGVRDVTSGRVEPRVDDLPCRRRARTVSPVSTSASQALPDSAKTTFVAAASVAYETMPSVDSRLRSRRASSACESVSPPPPSSRVGSATIRSESAVRRRPTAPRSATCPSRIGGRARDARRATPTPCAAHQG